ncbi:MAG: hypothetical protein M1820_004011 [Bogoriella megaspora]|nr:MAG: hypothetical protein M1820_004011 [Bogoriella megaspora]
MSHIIPPSRIHTHTIILLHGRDSTAEEFAEEFFESRTSDNRSLTEIFPHARWVFPQSDIRYSVRFGSDMTQWFDMWSTENPRAEEHIQSEGLRKSVQYIQQCVQIEKALVPLSRIILGGISQGCAAAVWSLLCANYTLGGFIGFSGWMPREEILRNSGDDMGLICDIEACLGDTQRDQYISPGPAATATPVFISHCRDDEVVPIEHGLAMSNTLRERGARVTWKEYETGGHWIQEPQGIDDLVNFMKHSMVRMHRL